MRGIISCLIVYKYNSLILWLLLGLPISMISLSLFNKKSNALHNINNMISYKLISSIYS